MSLQRADVRSYFQAHAQYFYAWEDGGDVLSIPRSNTICYRSYLVEVLELLAEQGAPPLGVLLLAFIATSADRQELLPVVRDIIVKMAKFSDGSPLPILDVAFSFLDKLSGLPPQFLTGPDRIRVFLAVFAGCHNLVGRKRIKAILSEFTRLDSSSPVFTTLNDRQRGIYAAHLQVLAILDARFPTVQHILDKVADVPELDTLVPDPELPSPEQGTVTKDLVAALEQHPETFHTGVLIRRIWSGLSIPFHSLHPTVQPLGGVSDLSNKGSLDKLLISEFAHDDLVFLSRLANGEALYINRETPPETNKLHRVLLIDSSLQAWGTPRTLAYAIALAIAHHPKTAIPCSAYAVGGTQQQVFLSSVAELITGLAVLDTSLDAAEGLNAFFRNVRPPGPQEVFFLTSPEGLQQPAVQKAVSDHQAGLSYCITAGPDGRCSVSKKSGRGFKQVQAFQLPLQELWRNPPVAPKMAAANAWQQQSVQLPSQYPILFPHPPGVKQTLTTNDGQVFVVTDNKALYRKAKRSSQWLDKGWICLKEDLPAGTCTYEMGRTADGDYLLLCYVAGGHMLHLFNLSNGLTAAAPFDARVASASYSKFLFWQNDFYLLGRQEHFIFRPGFDPEELKPCLEMERVKGLPEALTDAYASRQAALTAVPAYGGSSGQLLKNIKRVFITGGGELALNNHVLRLHEAGRLRFTVTTAPAAISAHPTARNEFTFFDGSTVVVNRNGMVILKSACETIAPVYIPTLLDMPLGMATAGAYAGADFSARRIRPRPRCWRARIFTNVFPIFSSVKSGAVQVTLKQSEHRQAGKPAAMLVRGEHPMAWLQAMKALPLPLERLEAYVIPGSVPASVMACLLLTDIAADKALPPAITLLSLVAGSIFIPEYTILSPALSDAELREIFSGGPYLLHPEAGLVLLEDRVRWEELLVLPAPSAWQFTSPAKPVFRPSTVRSFEIKAREEEEALASMEAEIAPEKKRFDDKPLTTAEQIRLAVYRKLFGSSAEGRADREGGGFMDRLGSFAKGLLGKGFPAGDRLMQDFEDLERRNAHEVEKLLRMFRDDPAEALKYAIPLGDGTGRGAEGGALGLFNRWGNFSLFGGGGPGGGGSAPLDDHYHRQLYEQYRQTAEALIRDGDHRKAAFIYMKLLKEYRAAAAALVQGGFYEEAAAIYLSYAHDKEAAADCYVKANMLSRAIGLYAELGKDELAGDLCMQLNRRTDAMHHYDKVKAAYAGKQQFIKAAVICRDKMDDPEGAQQLLISGWRSNRDAGNCLDMYFANMQDPARLGAAVDRVYREDVTRHNASLFLRAIRNRQGDDLQVDKLIRQTAYDLISRYGATDATLVSELRFFNKKDTLITRDILRYKLAAKGRK